MPIGSGARKWERNPDINRNINYEWQGVGWILEIRLYILSHYIDIICDCLSV